MARKTMPTRPHDAKCGDLVRSDSSGPAVRRKISGPTRVTVDRKELCDRDATRSARISDDLAVALCSHHFEKRAP